MSIQTYSNNLSYHQVLKVELIMDDRGDTGLDTKRVVIHQLVETDREGWKSMDGWPEGYFVMEHEITLFPSDDGPISVSVDAARALTFK